MKFNLKHVSLFSVTALLLAIVVIGGLQSVAAQYTSYEPVLVVYQKTSTLPAGTNPFAIDLDSSQGPIYIEQVAVGFSVAPTSAALTSIDLVQPNTYALCGSGLCYLSPKCTGSLVGSTFEAMATCSGSEVVKDPLGNEALITNAAGTIHSIPYDSADFFLTVTSSGTIGLNVYLTLLVPPSSIVTARTIPP